LIDYHHSVDTALQCFQPWAQILNQAKSADEKDEDLSHLLVPRVNVVKAFLLWPNKLDHGEYSQHFFRNL
jgi:hypothetical protein